MKFRQALLCSSVLAVVAAIAVPLNTQAQTIGWMDRLFTFREDQRPNPNAGARASRPTYVLQPAYSHADHVQWNNFYSNPNLAAQDYMIGSASKVMRPAGSGMTMMGNRALENIRDARDLEGGNLQIGEPGEFLGDNGNLGRATQISEPTNDWRETAEPNMRSRPGDFDYEAPRDRAAPLASGGETLVETTPKFSMPVVASPEGSPNLPTETDKLNQYQVQRGDTLGGIAAKPEIYNESALWPLIYSANRSKIGTNPNRLKPRMELKIPRDYTPEQAKKARQRAGRR
jgi:hypothetical protein